MNPVIESVATVLDTDGSGSIESSAEAGTACIETSATDLSDVDLLVNVGVYRDDNIVEPAIASMIQQQMGLNLDPVNGTFDMHGSNTFSFDLMNSAVGAIQAIQVAGSLMATGQIEHALIVSADGHPSKEHREEFPYTPSAAAALLSPPSRPDSGFQAYRIDTAAGAEDVVSGTYTFGVGDDPREIYVTVPPEYVDDLRAHVVATTRDFLEEEGLDPESLDGIVLTQPEAGFAASVAEELGVADETVVETFEEYGDTYTSSLFFGYEQGSFSQGDQVLFLGGGSDMTAACALYRA